MRSCGFVDLDDGIYVTDNPHVLHGLTASGIAWAFTTTTESTWHPLTWMSLMLDASLGGGGPRAFHATNLLFHLANGVILFLVLLRATGFFARSWLVAALFAVHPLHVESVAWVVERKDVLSTFFGLLAIAAYLRYVSRRSAGRMTIVAAAFAASLLSKPMLVTLPLLLLLLDFWPLCRLDRPSLRALLLEKVPLLLLSAGSIAVTALAARSGGPPTDSIPLASRFANAAVSCVAYLVRTAWPARLAVFYPLPRGGPSVALAALAGAALAATTAASILFGRRAPWVPAGWLWYLVSLVPVLGIVRVGMHASADRFTYVPLIGVFVLVVWSIAEATARVRRRSRAVQSGVAAGATAVIAALTLATRAQVAVWADTRTLFEHALAVTTGNWMAHDILGRALDDSGRTTEAIAHYKAALAIKPDYGSALVNLGTAFMKLGNDAAAAEQFERAVRVRPDSAVAHLGAAGAWAGAGRPDAALAHYREALRLVPNSAETHDAMGALLSRQGRTAEAIEHFEEAVRLRPGFAGALNNLGLALARESRGAEAIQRFRQAIEAAPGNAEAHNNLGVALAQQGRMAEALDQFERAVSIAPEYGEARTNLERARVMVGGRAGAPR